MEDPESLRVGLIGCGYQGRRLAQVIALTSSIEVKACADIDLEAAAKLASSIGHPTKHPSVDDLLENANVDVVMVATPHHVLADISLKAIEAGKHVLVEKPIGMIEQEAARIEEAVARKGVCFMSGYSLRYLPAWQKVKDLLAMGAIGEIQAMTGSFGIYPMNDGWLANPDTGGGPLLYIGSHLIDQVLWYIEDDPIEVYANIRYRHDTQADEITAFQTISQEEALLNWW